MPNPGSPDSSMKTSISQQSKFARYQLILIFLSIATERTSPLVLQLLPKLLHASEEAFGLGAIRAALPGLLEFAQQLLLAAIEIDRCFDLRLDIHIAVVVRAQHGHALALEPELRA